LIVVHKVDRLRRSLADFAKLVELFDTHDVSFVSVTQRFNTTTSMGRQTLLRPKQTAKLPPSCKQHTDRTLNSALKPSAIFCRTGRDAPTDRSAEIQTKHISLYGLPDANRVSGHRREGTP